MVKHITSNAIVDSSDENEGTGHGGSGEISALSSSSSSGSENDGPSNHLEEVFDQILSGKMKSKGKKKTGATRGTNGNTSKYAPFNIVMFAAKEASKDLKKQTGKNTYMVLNSNLPFDPWRAQLLVRIENTLKPRKLNINDYEIHFTITRVSPSPLLVALDEDYLNMFERVGRSKDSECNVYLQELCLSTKVGSPSKSVICLLNVSL